MRALEWQRRLQQQQDEFHKVVFTTPELANLAGTAPAALNVALRRLVGSGVLMRYAPGRYGLPGAVHLEDLVPALDSTAYLTGQHAMYRHRLITQKPAEAVCFSLRRHNRSRVRRTPLGNLVFVCVGPAIHSLPQETCVAPPEQAFCDFVLLCRRQGLRAESLVTFRNLDRLDPAILAATLARYPVTVRREAARLLAAP